MLQSLVASVQPLIILVQGPPGPGAWGSGHAFGERKTKEFPSEKDGFDGFSRTFWEDFRDWHEFLDGFEILGTIFQGDWHIIL